MKFVFSPLKCKDLDQRGFSLVELLITIGIVIMVTGAVLVKHTSFSSSTLLKSQALEISLDIRTAQQYSISARADRTDTRAAYGVYFDAQNPGRYQLFLDADDDSLYDTGEEVGLANALDSRFFIKEICHQNSSGRQCSSNRKASVAFKRPNFDGIVRTSWADGSNYGVSNRTWIDIVIAPVSDTDTTRTVTVYQTGQIAVQ